MDVRRRFLRGRGNDVGLRRRLLRRNLHRLSGCLELLGRSREGGHDRGDRTLESAGDVVEHRPAFAATCVDIDRDRQVHVDHGRGDDGIDGVGLPLPTGAVEPADAPFGLDDLDQPRNDEIIAADIPAGLQAEPVVCLPDLRDRSFVGRIEFAFDDDSPVFQLHGFRVSHVLLVLKHRTCFLKLLDVSIELVQNRRKNPLDRRLGITQKARFLVVEARKLAATIDGAGVRHWNAFLQGQTL